MRDQKTEAFLDRGQWKWKYEPSVPFTAIDITYSADNPARLSRRLDDERVMQYAEEMQDGVEFPGIVLLSPSDREIAQYDVATGMHRLSAADMAQTKTPKHIDAYIVSEPDRYRRDVLTRSLNTIEGRGANLQEQILHVIYLHEKYKQPLSTLCKEWHLKEASVRLYFRAEQAKRRARQFGFDLEHAKPRLSQSILASMNSALHSDRVFEEVTKFILHHGPSASIVDELCKSVKDIRDEAQALQMIQAHVKAEDERQQRERAKTARTRTGPAQNMMGNATRFNRQVAKGVDQLFLSSLPDPDVMKARALLEEMIENAKRILAELERIEKINANQKSAPIAA